MSYIDYTGSGELYITGISEAAECEKSHIDRVITVCQDSIDDNVSPSIEYSHYCMADGPDNVYGGDSSYEMFSEAADELYRALSTDESVLIHCHHGTSRSVSVACAALGRLLNISRSEALDIVHHYRPRENYPDPLLMEHATQYINERFE